MKKLFVWLIAISFGAIFLVVFLVLPFSAQAAGSCKCYETNSDGSYSNNIKIDGVYCKEVPTDKCYIDQFKDENGNTLEPRKCKSSVNYSVTQGKQATYSDICYSRVCQPYLDNKCEKPFGEDKSASVNQCWTKSDCDSADGKWDDGRKLSPKCTPLGTEPTARCFVKPPKIKLQISIPGLPQEFDGGFPEYLATFYKFFVGFMAVAAVVMIMWGGFKRLMAAGSAEKIKDANGAIFSAIIGLVLVLISYTLLNLINPQLVALTGLNLDKIKTENFGAWCPEKDPITKTTIGCGYKTSIDGNACVGKVCTYQGKGCYKIGDSKEVDANGKSKDYDCMYGWEACSKVTDDTVKELHGAGSGNDYSVYENACRKYTSNDGVCTWVEHGTFTNFLLDSKTFQSLTGSNFITQGADSLIDIIGAVGTIPTWSIQSLFGSDDKCEYYSNKYIEAYCKGEEFKGNDLGDPKKKCQDYNTAGNVGGAEWAACQQNWCKEYPDWQGETCFTAWNNSKQNWTCWKR